MDLVFVDCKVGNGASYRGSISITGLGVACQDWNAMTPHQSSFTSNQYSDRGLESNVGPPFVPDNCIVN